MITVKTPLRVSFFGGGSDLPHFVEKYGGAVISMTINKYVWVSMRKRQDSLIVLDSPFGHECCEAEHQIKHPSVRTVLQKYGVSSGISVWITSDVTHLGCGLGTDSALIVGLLNALFFLNHRSLASIQLAQAAAQIQLEIGDSGVQDGYACAVGGYNHYNFEKDGSVQITKLAVPSFSGNLMLFNTGKFRDSRKIQSAPKSDEMLLEIKRLANDFTKIPVDKQDQAFPEFLGYAWDFKRRTSSSISNERIDQIYEQAMMSGAKAGKLLGAGGGGYFLFYVQEKYKANVRRLLSNIGVVEMPFTFDPNGTILNDSIFL